MLTRKFFIYWGGHQVNPDADDRRNVQVFTVGPFCDRNSMIDWSIAFTSLVAGEGHSFSSENVSSLGEFDPSLTPVEIWEKVKEVRRAS